MNKNDLNIKNNKYHHKFNSDNQSFSEQRNFD